MHVSDEAVNPTAGLRMAHYTSYNLRSGSQSALGLTHRPGISLGR